MSGFFLSIVVALFISEMRLWSCAPHSVVCVAHCVSKLYAPHRVPSPLIIRSLSASYFPAFETCRIPFHRVFAPPLLSYLRLMREAFSGTPHFSQRDPRFISIRTTCFIVLLPRTMAKIAHTLCENAAQHISIVRNYALSYLEQCTTPLIYCHYGIPLRSIAERGTEAEQK